METDIIRDPVHNYIIVNEKEKELIDTEPVQRLRYLKQTPSASFVYPGANHTRFEHSLGVCHLVGEIAKSLKESGSVTDLNDWDKDVQKARIAALLHDVGHGPFSHTFESFLEMLNIKLTHEVMTQLIIKKRLAGKIKGIFDLEDADVQDISNMAVGKIMAVGDGGPRLYLAPMVAGQIDADKMDFLQRDAVHTGTIEYGSIDVKRLILNLRLIEINGVKIVGIKDRAAFAIESLLLSRYHMYRAVYYHRTARSFDLMLCDAMGRAIEEIDGLKWFAEGSSKIKTLIEKESDELENFLSDYLLMDDYSMMSELNKLAKTDERLEIMNKIRKREHYRHAYDTIFFLDSSIFREVLDDPVKKTEREKKIKNSAEVSNMVRIDVPYEIVMLDHSQITIINDEEEPMPLDRYLSGLGGEKMSIFSNLSKFGKRFLIVNVFTDTTDKEVRKKIKEAARLHLHDGGETRHI